MEVVNQRIMPKRILKAVQNDPEILNFWRKKILNRKVRF